MVYQRLKWIYQKLNTKKYLEKEKKSFKSVKTVQTLLFNTEYQDFHAKVS